VEASFKEIGGLSHQKANLLPGRLKGEPLPLKQFGVQFSKHLKRAFWGKIKKIWNTLWKKSPLETQKKNSPTIFSQKPPWGGGIAKSINLKLPKMGR